MRVRYEDGGAEALQLQGGKKSSVQVQSKMYTDAKIYCMRIRMRITQSSNVLYI